jgi:hypothetical protein
MKTITLSLWMVVWWSMAMAQNAREVYSKARVWLSKENSLKKLAALGVETDHGLYKKDRFFESGFSEKELNRIKNAGFAVDILVPDVAADFLQKNGNTQPDQIQNLDFDPICNKVKMYKKPRYWRLGGMGGHMRYEEMIAQIDSMRLLFPNLISAKSPIDTTKTREGRQIWFVRISDNPNSSEPSEPQGLFSAIHHAREPVSMHQLLFYMWYLLENYSTQPDIKNLVDNTELYFVPCLNPDGYIFNQTNFPNGGGMWRKNRRDNQDGSFGVDLNRNYGYNWGFDDFGSSPDPDFDTYRGDEPFSEPETRAMKAFCERQNFILAQNYHTYSNLIIYPWGYSDLEQTPDNHLFRILTREMNKENDYRIGTGMEVLNYNSNGSSDDYMYAQDPQKPKILSMTPEVGDWFWPTQNEILGLCQETVHQNLTFSRALLPMIKVVDTTGLFHKAGLFPNSGPFRIRYKVTRIGTNPSPATFTLTFRPFGPNSAGLQTQTKTYQNLAMQQTRLDSIIITNPPASLLAALPVQWELTISNGTISWKDTLVHYGGEPNLPAALKENCDNLSRWSGNWVIVAGGQQEGSGFLKQTAGDYNSNMDESITRRIPFDLRSPNIKAAELSFWTKYNIERNFDFAQLMLSTDSGTSWTNVCTDKTTMSSPFSQQAGPDVIIPIWDGEQAFWQKEYLNLAAYLGRKLWLRFRLFSDDLTESFGIGIDNISITINSPNVSTQELLKDFSNLVLVPNPGTEKSGFQIFGLKQDEKVWVQVFNTTGQEIFGKNELQEHETWQGPILAPGVYQVKIHTRTGVTQNLKWLVGP